jgi:hypothetical protein
MNFPSLAAAFAYWQQLSKTLLRVADCGRRKMMYIETVRASHLFGLKYHENLSNSQDTEDLKITRFDCIVIDSTKHAITWIQGIESRPRSDEEEY